MFKKLFCFAFAFTVLHPLQAQIGSSLMVEHSPMDMTGYNAVISDQLNGPVLSNMSSFLKVGAGIDFTIEKIAVGFYLSTFNSANETRVDTAYSFQNIRFEINIGYQVLQTQKLVLEPYLGWAVNNTDYNKKYNIGYSSLSHYWNSPLNFKYFGYNLHHLNTGLRVHFQKFSINRNAEIGFSLRGGLLIPLSNGNIKFNDQKIRSENLLINQSFYVGLICSVSAKTW